MSAGDAHSRQGAGGEALTGLSAAALPDNDRAERLGFVKTVFFFKLRTKVRRSASFQLTAIGVGSHPLAPT